MQRRSLFIWVFLILVFSLMTGCQGDEPTSTPGNETEVDPSVSEPVSASGEVLPGRWIQAGFTTSGIIEKILVEQGEMVSAGDELAKLNETPFQLASSQANAALREAEAILEDLQAQPRADAVAAAEAAVKNAEADLDRLERSRVKEIELAAAQAQIDSAQAALNEIQKGASESQIRSASADVQSALIMVEQSRQALEQSVLKAPFGGMVFEIYLQKGDAALPGTPVILLADPESLQIETTDLSELDVTRIQIGDSVKVTIDALPELALDGRVAAIANRPTPGPNVTYRVTIKLDQIPDELRWGMSAFVTIGR